MKMAVISGLLRMWGNEECTNDRRQVLHLESAVSRIVNLTIFRKKGQGLS